MERRGEGEKNVEWRSTGAPREMGRVAYLERRVDDAAQSEREARNILANPVRVGNENHVNVADEVLRAGG